MLSRRSRSQPIVGPSSIGQSVLRVMRPREGRKAPVAGADEPVRLAPSPLSSLFVGVSAGVSAPASAVGSAKAPRSHGSVLEKRTCYFDRLARDGADVGEFDSSNATQRTAYTVQATDSSCCVVLIARIQLNDRGAPDHLFLPRRSMKREVGVTRTSSACKVC